MKLDVPDCDYRVVQVEATPFQQELVQELADRADAINAGNIDPTIDNMLKITSDGRKLGLDPRLIDPSFEDNPDTKLNRCVENVACIHAETAEDRLTQIIFCDLGVPHKAAEAAVEGEDADDAKDKKSIAEVESLEEECDFCVYDDIRDKLIARGIQEWLGHSNFSITANLYSHLEYNAKVNSAETIARVLGGKSEDKSEAEKPAEKKKTTRRKSTPKAASKTPPQKTGGRKKKSDNPEGTGESQMSTL